MLLVPDYFEPAAPTHRWRHIERDGVGPLRGISEGILQHELRFGEVLPDFRGSSELFIASDYSGSRTDKKARYEVLSFLIFPFHEAREWHSLRLQIRERLQGRSISFKAMNDVNRRRVLPAFFRAADTIPGVLITIALSKQHASLFQRERLDLRVGELQQFQHWHRDVFEKLLRVTHILAFFLSGVSHPGQSFVWYTDNDDIAANVARTQELGRIWRAAVVNLVPHHVPSLTIGAERDDDPSHSLEDVLAIPDLACGAWCQLLSALDAQKFIDGAPETKTALSQLSRPALEILRWFAVPAVPLKRVLCIIDDPQPNNTVDYMSAIPPALNGFRAMVESLINEETAA